MGYDRRNICHAHFTGGLLAQETVRGLRQRGYRQSTKRPLEPGEFDLVEIGGMYTLTFHERGSDDQYAAREAVA